MIELLLPHKPRGVPRVDNLSALTGIVWVLRSGTPWRELPERYGPAHHPLEPPRAVAEGERAGPVNGSD